MDAIGPQGATEGSRDAPRDLRAYGVARQLRALASLGPRQIGALLVEAYSDWSTDGAARLGAALSYYTLFSIAPILIVVTGVAGLFLGRAAARGQIAPFLERALGADGAKAAELMLQQTVTPAGGIVTTAIGLVSLFLATSFLVNEMRQSLNIVWRVQPRSSDGGSLLAAMVSTLGDRVYGFVVVAGAGLLVILSVVVNAGVAVAGAYFRAWLPLPEIALQAINFLVTFALISFMFTLLYKVLPDAYVSWGDACVGAIATALLFTLGGMMLSTFVGKAAGGSLYGTAGSVLALLAWVYYSAQVFFFGAELTRLFANRYGCRIEPRHRSLSNLARPLRP